MVAHTYHLSGGADAYRSGANPAQVPMHQRSAGAAPLSNRIRRSPGESDVAYGKRFCVRLTLFGSSKGTLSGFTDYPTRDAVTCHGQKRRAFASVRSSKEMSMMTTTKAILIAVCM